MREKLCFLLGLEFGISPDQIYQTLTYRQIRGYLALSTWWKRKTMGKVTSGIDKEADKEAELKRKALEDFRAYFGSSVGTYH